VTFIWPPVTAISGRHRRHSSGHPRIHSHGQGQAWLGLWCGTWEPVAL